MRTRACKEALRRSGNQLPLPPFENLIRTPVVKMAEHDYMTRQSQPQPRKRRPAWRLGAVCCTLVFAAALSWFTQFRVTDSIVTLDVNPSVKIAVNRQQTVLSVEDLNEDARELLSGRDYRGQSLEQAVEALILQLAENGFLKQEHSFVLLSVETKNQQRAQQLEDSLSSHIETILHGRQIDPVIISQSLAPDEASETAAHQYGISPGKLQFIHSILKQNDRYSLEQLAGMTLEDLLHVASDESPQQADGVDDTPHPESGQNSSQQTGEEAVTPSRPPHSQAEKDDEDFEEAEADDEDDFSDDDSDAPDSPDDAPGETDSPDDDSGETDSADDDSGETDSSDDASGESDSPDDDSGETDSSDDDSGESDSPDDAPGETDSSDDAPDETDSSDDASGETDSSDDAPGETDSSDDASGDVSR